MKTLALVFGMGLLVACGGQTEQSKRQQASTGTDTQTEALNDDSTSTGTSESTASFAVSAVTTTTSFSQNSTVILQFRLASEVSSGYEVVLADAPGGFLATDADDPTLVTYTWTTPTVGTHQLRLVLRDQSGVQADQSSDAFSFTVETSSSSSPTLFDTGTSVSSTLIEDLLERLLGSGANIGSSRLRSLLFSASSSQCGQLQTGLDQGEDIQDLLDILQR